MKPKRRKEPTILELLQRSVDELGTVVDERWFVQEYKPAHVTSGYYGGWLAEVTHATSQYFDSEAQAKAFMEKMEPDDKSHKFRIVHQRCYERLERRWL